ncbi:MAG: hypothetical protein ACI9R3_004240 [Verrucomicrobiales bacterium]|jgi:hypothetical protein
MARITGVVALENDESLDPVPILTTLTVSG